MTKRAHDPDPDAVAVTCPEPRCSEVLTYAELAGATGHLVHVAAGQHEWHDDSAGPSEPVEHTSH